MNTAEQFSTIAHQEKSGTYHVGDVNDLLRGNTLAEMRGRVQLILTSPPFPLNNKKKYGNLKGQEYLEWFTNLAPVFSDYLTDDGSIVIEVGNSWEPDRPVQSLLALQSLLAFINNPETEFRLIQEFICYNPSRLPSPASWVTVNRIRTVDSYTRVWWIAKNDYPKADNTKVLKPYSRDMQRLLEKGKYNPGKRPSEHKVGETSFLRDCGGSIAHNFIEMDSLDPLRQVRLPNAFSFSNTASTDFFSRRCKELGVVPHPARMPMGLAAFFIQFLTDAGDLVLDPFGGSNTTGYAAARLGRNWVALDAMTEYAQQSQIRFQDPALNSQ